MKVARFRIAWGMVGIAIAALDFAVIRAMLCYLEIGFFVLGTKADVELADIIKN